MYKYYIRVDKHDGYEQGISILESMCEMCLGVYHTGKSQDNPHWHFAIQLDVKTVPCLRARLRKFWSVPKSLSIKVFDGDEKGLKYLFHEKDRASFSVVSQKGYSDEQVKSFKEESHCKDRKSRERKERAPTFTQMVMSGLWQGVKSHLKNYNIQDTIDGKFVVSGIPEQIIRHAVGRYIVDCFGENAKVFDKFILKRFYNLACLEIFGNSFREELVCQIMQD